MPEFYMKIARIQFFPEIWALLAPAPVSYAYGEIYQ